MIVTITEQNIYDGVENCKRDIDRDFGKLIDMNYLFTEDPMSLAFNQTDEFKYKKVTIGIATYSIWQDTQRLSTDFLPKKAVQFNKDFATNRQLNPLSFEI